MKAYFKVPLSKTKNFDHSLMCRAPKLLNYLIDNDLLPSDFMSFSVGKVNSFVAKATRYMILQNHPLVDVIFDTNSGNV